jgi:hypothetical protein
MPQFNVRLSDKTLRPEDEASLRAFADLKDWALPSSTQLHGAILQELLRADVYDSHVVAEALRLLAAQRMALYADRLSGSAELPLWLDWLERIEELKNVEDDPAADLDLVKKELRLSVELIDHAKELLRTDECASRVLYASGCEIGEAADVRTVSDISERLPRARAIAEIAKHSSFDEAHRRAKGLVVAAQSGLVWIASGVWTGVFRSAEFVVLVGLRAV